VKLVLPHSSFSSIARACMYVFLEFSVIWAPSSAQYFNVTLTYVIVIDVVTRERDNALEIIKGISFKQFFCILKKLRMSLNGKNE
jgi:hypothetical protein